LASEVQMEDITVGTIVEEADKHLKEYRKASLRSGSGVVVEDMVLMGLAVDMILLAAKEKKVDLVVMGTKGASGLEELVLGSNTSAVMERSSCPVLAVPGKASFHGFKKIVFATNYSEGDIQSLNFLSGIASVFDAEIMIVHIDYVIRDDEFESTLFKLYRDKIEEEVAYKKFSFHLIPMMNVAKGLNSVVEENQVDLIAVSTRKRNIITRLFDRSLTKKLACHTHIPLLSLHQ